MSASPRTAMEKLRIVSQGLAWGDRERPLMNDGQIPNTRGVRVHVSTGYNPVEGSPVDCVLWSSLAVLEPLLPRCEDPW
jgi:hypothetical protein